jgi:hypothetical protein
MCDVDSLKGRGAKAFHSLRLGVVASLRWIPHADCLPGGGFAKEGGLAQIATAGGSTAARCRAQLLMSNVQ